MQTGAVTFGNGGNSRSSSVLGAVKDSALNVGVTAGAGILAGGAVGKIVSLIPSKTSEAAMKFQYGDMFERFTRTSEVPKYLQGKSEEIVQAAKDGISLRGTVRALKQKWQETGIMGAAVANATEDAIKQESFQTKIREFLHDAADKVPEGGYTKEGILERLKTSYGGLEEAIESKSDTLLKMQGEFVEKLKNLGDKDINALAEKSAKHLRAKSIVGAGMAAGMLIALTLNILKTYGVIGRKPNANQQNLQKQTTLQTHQG